MNRQLPNGPTDASARAVAAANPSGNALGRGPDQSEWMKPKEAAADVRSSTSTLAKRRLTGGGPRFHRIGRAIRYHREDLDIWLMATGRRSTSDTGEVR